MRGLIHEESTSPRKLSVSFNSNSTSSTTEIAPANAQPTPEMSRHCCVVSGALSFSEELKQSYCGKAMSDIIIGIEEIGNSMIRLV